MGWFFDIFGNIGDRKPVVSTTKVPTLEAMEERSISIPEISTVTDWGHLIYSYVTNLYGKVYDAKREDRARKEVEGRGLAFGQIIITGGDSRSVKLRLPNSHQPTSAETFKTTLEKIIQARGLNDHLEIDANSHKHDVKVIFKDQSDQTFNGATWSGSRNGQSVRWKEFLSASCLSGHDISVTTYSDEAIRVLIQVAELLGFFVGPRHYAHESSAKIEDIVVYASRWEDPESGCRYFDIVWRPELIKHHIYHGSNRSDKRTVSRLKKEVMGLDCRNGDELWPLKGEVLACEGNGDWWPKMTINNKPVYSTIIQKPTEAMLRAKEKFIKESVQKCSVCHDLATKMVSLSRLEVGDMSMGSIYYTCDKPSCLEQVQEKKHIKASVMPYQQEVWA